MQRLTLDQWKTVYSNLSEDEDIEILWLDGTDEWVLAYDTDLFEDGFETEKEAMKRIVYIEDTVLD